jgi:putative membrane-bound dehydrogenase-like protein
MHNFCQVARFFVARFCVCFFLIASPGFASDFPTPVNTEKSAQQPMAPDEVVKTATLPEGFRLSVFAAEPDVQNPIAITTDHKGRLWVAENYTWAGNSLGNYRTDLRDRIIILEDTDGDGKHDKRTVFTDRLTKVTSVEVGFGGVWVIALPNLLFIPDRDADDIPDGPPEIVLDGFNEDSVSHTPANGLRWGPDGWLYARHGILATSSIGAPGATESQRVKINTGVWRYHPTRKEVETVMHGMTNSWGFDYNKNGAMFCINTVIGHLWHVIPGARTERMFGTDMNPRAYQLLPQVADHVHWDTGEVWHQVREGVSDTTLAAGGGHAHIGLMIYQGDNWPAAYRDKVFTLNLHGKRINCDRLERDGAAYVAKHEPDLVIFNDPFFRGMDLITGPDGGVFIADWSDTGECHDHDGVHRTSGRIYKLTYKTPPPITNLDLSRHSIAELLQAQLHPNAWFGRQARRILQERRWADPAIKVSVDDFPSAETADQQLSLAWAKRAAGINDFDFLFQSPDENHKTWAVRFAADDFKADVPCDAEVIKRLQSAVQDDTSGIVSLYIASAAQRLPSGDRLKIAEALIQRADLANDRFFPIMVWLSIEPVVDQSGLEVVDLCKISKLPLVTRNIARAVTESIESRPQDVQRLITIALNGSGSSSQFSNSHEIILGMSEALAGWNRAPKPVNWSSDWKSYTATSGDSDHDSLQQAVTRLNLVFGDGQAMDLLVSIATDAAADPRSRRQSIAAISSAQAAGFDRVLLTLLADRAVQREVLQGLAYYDSPETPGRALAMLGTYSPETRQDLIRLLVTRAPFAKELLNAVQDGRISATEISAYHARQIQDLSDSELTERLRSLWGDVRPTAEDKRATIESLRSELTPERLAKADLSRGRVLFNQVCSNCHVLYGQGKKVGPDLTGSNRNHLDYLLENIIDPSASVAADFRTTIFVLDDGRVLAGVKQMQTEKTVAVQTADGVLVIDRDSIAESKPTATSLMPEALLQNLSANDTENLFAYLMSTSQVSLERGTQSQ